jgi:hypothetical protein
MATNQANPILGPGYSRSDGGLFSNPNVGNTAFGNTRAADNTLRKVLGLDGDSSASIKREAGDMRDSRELFGFGNNYKPATRMTPSEMQHRDAFMEIYNPNHTPTAAGSGSSGGLFTPDSSFYDPPKPAPALTTTVLPSSSPSAITTYTPSYTPPAPAPAQSTPAPAPVSPFMSPPRRNL